jgi:hypothetical protein
MIARARRRILLAWESGAGRGHIVTLRTVADALGDGFEFDASLCVMDHAAELEPVCSLVFPGARLFTDPAVRGAPGALRTATWGEFLGDTGFRDPQFLVTQVKWWQEVLAGRAIDMVIADYAPCALLAARSMGINAVTVGTGYGIPPQGLDRFPVFLPEYNACLYDEAEMVATINSALLPLGVPALTYLSDVYRRSHELIRTLDILDPYTGMRDLPLMPPVADVAQPAASPGDEIFIYFSTTELQDAGVIEAVTTLGLPVRAFCPGIAPDLAARFVAAGVRLESRPVPVEQIAERSRMIVHSGQHGILCLGLASGLPQVAIPQHLEQLYHARRCEEAGAGRVVNKADRAPDRLRSIIRETYDDLEIRQRAIHTAHRLREQFAVDPATMIRARLLPLLG